MRARRLALLSVLLLVIGEIGADAATRTPRIIAAERVDGWVEFGVRGRNNRRERRDADTTFARDDVKLDEILHVGLDGYVWYPRLMRFDIGAELHFLQNLTSGDNLILPLGDFRVHFLEKKPYGLTAFALVSEDEVEESFGRSFETRVESYGAGLRFGLGPLPFTLRYAHRFRDRTGDPEADLVEEGDEIELLGNYRFREGSDGGVRFIYSDTTALGRKIIRHEVQANNVTYFDDKQWKRFTGLVRFYEWGGRSDSSNASVFGTYDWRHTENLRSTYSANYQYRRFDTQTTNVYDANASINHQLYDSLSSSFIVLGNLQDSSFGKIGEYGFRIRENYTKLLGSWGQLGIGMHPYTRFRHSRPTQETAFVDGETAVFVNDDPAELRQRDVVTSSIVVTSPDETIVYRENIDYTIRVEERRTLLVRELGGLIPTGGAVRVTYEYELGGNNDLVTYGFRSDVSLDYRSWFTVFANALVNREDIVGGFTDRLLDDRDRYEIGVQTRQSWWSARISFDWEQLSVRSSFGALQSISLSTPWPGRWRGGLNVVHNSRDYMDPDEQMDAWRVHAYMRVRFLGSAMFEMDPEYRLEDWRGGNAAEARDVEAVGGTMAISWTMRSLEARAGLSIFRLQRPAVDELQDRFFLQVRRNF